jgi:hypothetical protein
MNTRTQTLRARVASGVALAMLLSLVACGGDDDDDDPPPPPPPPASSSSAPSAGGSLRLAMTDAPQCGYDHVYVTVSAIKVNQSGAAGDADAGWHTITLPTLPKRIDLLGLSNGLLEELGQTALPAGTYTQMRLMLIDNANQAPYANAVVPTGKPEAALTTPSAQQSGLKVNVNMTVQEGQLADFVLDFDACKSVVVAGNSGKYNLKPVITVLPRTTNAMSVDGYVSNATPGTIVSVQLNGVIVRSTAPASSGGFFAMPYLPQAGAHDLVISGPDIATRVVTAVPVSSTSITHVSLQGSPIVLSGSTGQTVSGTATAGGTVPDATVSAEQEVGAGRVVKVASRGVDADTGAYSFTLPTQSVFTAPYVATPAVLVWTPYVTTAGQYTIRSAVPGLPDQTKPANVSVLPAIVNFTY